MPCCDSCGTELSPLAKFCNQCGRQIEVTNKIPKRKAVLKRKIGPADIVALASMLLLVTGVICFGACYSGYGNRIFLGTVGTGLILVGAGFGLVSVMSYFLKENTWE